MRRAAAGPRGRVIVGDAVLRRRCAGGPYDWRTVVAISERQPVGDHLAGLASHDGFAQLAAGLRTRRRVVGNGRPGRLLAIAGVARVGMADIADADRAPFALVGVEQGAAAPAGVDG